MRLSLFKILLFTGITALTTEFIDFDRLRIIIKNID